MTTSATAPRPCLRLSTCSTAPSSANACPATGIASSCASSRPSTNGHSRISTCISSSTITPPTRLPRSNAGSSSIRAFTCTSRPRRARGSTWSSASLPRSPESASVAASSTASTDALSGDLGKEALDHVEPRARRGREVQVKARMLLEPAFDRGSLVGGVIVDDEMQVEIRLCPFVDGLEEAQELAMPVAGHAFADDGAVEHVESRKQGRGAVALVVMGHRPAAALFHRQPRLGAVEGLDWLFSSTASTRALSGGLR